MKSEETRSVKELTDLQQVIEELNAGGIPSDFLQPTYAQTSGSNNVPQEIILSQFLHM